MCDFTEQCCGFRQKCSAQETIANFRKVEKGSEHGGNHSIDR